MFAALALPQCKGSVAERIFEPLTARIRGAGGRILGSHLVTDVEVRV